MLYSLNLHSVVCQLYLNKTGAEGVLDYHYSINVNLLGLLIALINQVFFKYFLLVIDSLYYFSNSIAAIILVIFVGIFFSYSLFPEGWHLVSCSVLLHIFLHLERDCFCFQHHKPQALTKTISSRLSSSYFKILFLSCNWELTI